MSREGPIISPGSDRLLIQFDWNYLQFLAVHEVLQSSRNNVLRLLDVSFSRRRCLDEPVVLLMQDG